MGLPASGNIWGGRGIAALLSGFVPSESRKRHCSARAEAQVRIPILPDMRPLAVAYGVGAELADGHKTADAPPERSVLGTTAFG